MTAGWRKHRTYPVVGAQAVQPGTYGLRPRIGRLAPSRRSSVPCPYCREWLDEIMSGGRVVSRRVMVDLADVDASGGVMSTSVDVPSDYALLRCMPCDARFVVPRERLNS